MARSGRAARGAPRRGRSKGSPWPFVLVALLACAALAIFLLASGPTGGAQGSAPPSPTDPLELSDDGSATAAASAGAPVGQLQGAQGEEPDGLRPGDPIGERPARSPNPTIAASAGAPAGQLQGARGEEPEGLRSGSSRVPSPQRNAADGLPPPGRAKVAIVVDDCGLRLDLLQRAARMRQPLTFAVIPRLRHSRESAEAAHAAGHEVIVHQPMEPEPGADPGEGVLRVGMSRGRVSRVLRENFADVPHAAGLNNHMGSRATADEELMNATLQAVRELSVPRPLYFLDSRTTARTVALQAARRHGVPAAERAVFLDNDLAPEAVKARLEELLAVARRDGEAVGIGHLKEETISVLEEALPAADDVAFVFLSAIVR